MAGESGVMRKLSAMAERRIGGDIGDLKWRQSWRRQNREKIMRAGGFVAGGSMKI